MSKILSLYATMSSARHLLCVPPTQHIISKVEINSLGWSRLKWQSQCCFTSSVWMKLNFKTMNPCWYTKPELVSSYWGYLRGFFKGESFRTLSLETKSGLCNAIGYSVEARRGTNIWTRLGCSFFNGVDGNGAPFSLQLTTLLRRQYNISCLSFFFCFYFFSFTFLFLLLLPEALVVLRTPSLVAPTVCNTLNTTHLALAMWL